MKTPADKRIVLTFYSLPTARPAQRWKAQIVFEPGSCDGSPAAITVTDGAGEPVQAGIFELAGRSLPVSRGRASIPCADFAAGRHESGIWLRRKGMSPVPGALTFE